MRDRQRSAWATLSRTLALLLVIASCLLLPGCSGCTSSTPLTEEEKQKAEEEKRKKEKEKPKPDFETGGFYVLPGSKSAVSMATKPGHWFAAAQYMKANNFDFQAELHASTADANHQPLELEHAPYYMTMSRPAALPKGQEKQFEALYFVPRKVSLEEGQQAWLETRLLARHGGREIPGETQKISLLADCQYLLLVLAREPSAYGHLSQRYSMRITAGEVSGQPNIDYYRVLTPRVEKSLPLPTSALAYTTIAYIFWDDIDPNLVTPEQQTALVDWLHWGGQIIVSGPNSLESLRSSFLGDYLPATAGKSHPLVQTDFDELNKNFSLPEKQKPRRELTVVKTKPPLGVDLKLQAEATFVPRTGNLVAERRVGRGRIAVTAFALGDRQVVNWGNFDGFLNSCLLRRPRRLFKTNGGGDYRVFWRDFGPLTEDPRFSTTVRYFARDVGFLNAEAEREAEASVVEALAVRNRGTLANTPPSGFEELSPGLTPPPFEAADPQTADWHLGGFARSAQSGVAGWNDFSGASDAARRALREAAAIEPPKATFVLIIMGVYVLVLVPLNWLVFRLLGRVEWAWFAAPVLAILGTFFVVRMAQLDIGFERNRTELAVMEIQRDYPRAHLTRYMALYNSLSTTYNLDFTDSSALAMPFSVNPKFVRLRHQSPTNVHFVQDEAVSFSGFNVSSNTTGLIHCEQMLPLSGKLKLEGSENSGFQVANGTQFDLQGVGLLRRFANGTLRSAWLGSVNAGAVVRVRWSDQPGLTALNAAWDQSPATRAGAQAANEINLRSLLDLAKDKLHVFPGEARLLGWTEDEVPGTAILPAVVQSLRRTLIVAELEMGPLPDALPDVNTYHDLNIVSPFDDHAEPGAELDFSRQPAPTNP